MFQQDVAVSDCHRGQYGADWLQTLQLNCVHVGHVKRTASAEDDPALLLLSQTSTPVFASGGRNNAAVYFRGADGKFDPGGKIAFLPLASIDAIRLWVKQRTDRINSIMQLFASGAIPKDELSMFNRHLRTFSQALAIAATTSTRPLLPDNAAGAPVDKNDYSNAVPCPRSPDH